MVRNFFASFMREYELNSGRVLNRGQAYRKIEEMLKSSYDKVCIVVPDSVDRLRYAHGSIIGERILNNVEVSVLINNCDSSDNIDFEVSKIVDASPNFFVGISEVVSNKSDLSNLNVYSSLKAYPRKWSHIVLADDSYLCGTNKPNNGNSLNSSYGFISESIHLKKGMLNLFYSLDDDPHILKLDSQKLMSVASKYNFDNGAFVANK